MDFKFSPDDEQFRDALRRLLTERLPSDWDSRSLAQPPDAEERRALHAQLSKELAARKWLAMAWPSQFGGLDASHLRQLVFNEEMAYHDAPGGGGVGVSMAGPAIMLHGNEEQRRLYLPRIAGAEDTWAALYSEPGAGSDLASIQTRAVRDGDDYVLTGQKIWAAGAAEANMGLVAARTDPGAPKHRGISMFALPMDAPGIGIRPIESMAGDRHLNEVHLDRVRVPAANLIGVENRGWYQVAATLDFERSGVAAYAGGKRNVERLVRVAREERELVQQHPQVRYALADRWIELQVGFNIAYRIPWLQTQGISPNYEASI